MQKFRTAEMEQGYEAAKKAAGGVVPNPYNLPPIYRTKGYRADYLAAEEWAIGARMYRAEQV